MQKLEKKPVVKKALTLIERVRKATSISDLSRIKDLNISIEYGNIRVDLDEIEEGLDGLDSEKITVCIRHKNPLYYTRLTLEEQPSTCANLIMYSIQCSNLNTKEGEATAFAAITVAQEIAEILGYSYLWFTHLNDHQFVRIARTSGFTVTREYLNERTQNMLMDLHLKLDPH